MFPCCFSAALPRVSLSSSRITRGIRANEGPSFFPSLCIYLFPVYLSHSLSLFLSRARSFSGVRGITLFSAFRFTAAKPRSNHFFTFSHVHAEPSSTYVGSAAVLPILVTRGGASLPLVVVYATQGEPPFSYCADRPGLLSLLANRKRSFARDKEETGGPPARHGINASARISSHWWHFSEPRLNVW